MPGECELESVGVLMPPGGRALWSCGAATIDHGAASTAWVSARFGVIHGGQRYEVLHPLAGLLATPAISISGVHAVGPVERHHRSGTFVSTASHPYGKPKLI